ncbi:MAG: type II secretion system protein N [Limnohabitans sp.]
MNRARAMMHRPTATAAAARPWRWALLGAGIGLTLATLAGAPARWLADAVAGATQGAVQLRQVQGTLWSGDAVLTLTPGFETSEVRTLPSRLHWQWGLAWPGLTLSLSSTCCTTTPLQWRLSHQAGGPTLELNDQTSIWPLSMLAGLGAPWNTLQADGRLQWQSSGLRLSWAEGQWRWYGQASVLVQDLSSRLTTVQPMGSYRIDLRGADTGTTRPELNLTTLSGPLQLRGQGQWVDQRLRFEGEASADPGAEIALSNLLNIIGRREGPRSLLSLG